MIRPCAGCGRDTGSVRWYLCHECVFPKTRKKKKK